MPTFPLFSCFPCPSVAFGRHFPLTLSLHPHQNPLLFQHEALPRFQSSHLSGPHMDHRSETQNGSVPFPGSGHRNPNDMSIPELVSELRVTFLTSDFDRVERALVARESRLNAEIEEKKRGIGSLQEKIEVERLERISVELQLKKFKEEKPVNVKKEENDGCDFNYKAMGTVCKVGKRNSELEGEKCKHCVELKRKWDDEKGAVAELRKRNSKLEGEKFELLKEKKKWVGERVEISELRDENRRLGEEKRRTEALVVSWKGKFFELNERVLRLESDIVNGKLVADGGDGHRGGNNEEKKMVGIDGHESESSKSNEDDGLSSRTSPIIPSKDGLGASARGRSGTRTVIDIEDNDDEDECKSQGTLQKKDTTPQIMTDNELPSSSGAVQPKKLPIASSREVGANINILDGLASDTSSCSCSSSSGSFDMDSLPLSSFTSKKRMRTEPAPLRVNCLPK